MGVTRHGFNFDGINSEDKGLVVYGGSVDEIAVRSYEAITVPGRNGVLHLDNGRYDERPQAYLVYVPGESYADRLSYIRTTFGRRGKGYKRLEDTFNPDVYSMASFVDAITPESMAFRTVGLVTLSFQCRPERFLRNGEQVITATSPVTLANPTGMPAKPLLRAYGTAAGTVTIGNHILYIDAINEYIDIDCDSCDCSKGSTNCNGDVRIQTFPELGEGTTGISWTGGISRLEITPRWWAL